MNTFFDKYIKYKTKYLLGKNSFINNLIWRRAEKHFNPGPVPIDNIISAIVNAPTSFGIQPFKVIVILNQDLKKKLSPACFNQPQIEECYALFVFCAMENLEDRIKQYSVETGNNKKEPSMLSYINKMSSPIEWAKRQAYIALGFGMAAAMEQNIASCPMEGFIPEKVAEILNLTSLLKPCVLLTVGNKKDDYELEPRFRFTDLIKIEK